MTGKAIRRYEMLRRVSRFGEEHSASFPPETFGAATFTAVKVAVGALEQHAVAQAVARARDRVIVKAAARNRLRRLLRVIYRTARAIDIDAPAVSCRFRVPKTNGDRALLNAARGVAHDARERMDAFVAHGLAPTFLDDLHDEVNALEQASRDYHAVKQAGVSATAGVDAVLARGLKSVQRLDAIVANVCRDDVQVMAAWLGARRVGRKGRPERAKAGIPLRLVTNVA
jgi:hypothetical protein